MKTQLSLAVACALAIGGYAADYPAWKHSGSIYILTTPEGANLPAGATVNDFPLLVRLHKDFFDFTQAKAKGEDLRFSASTGELLKFQIEEWDAAKGFANIWVRIPKITGDSMEFDQTVKWDNALIGQFYLDGEKGKVASGLVTGSTITLKLLAPSSAKKLTYLDSAAWSQDKLLRGENGIAALTFCEVPIAK